MPHRRTRAFLLVPLLAFFNACTADDRGQEAGGGRDAGDTQGTDTDSATDTAHDAGDEPCDDEGATRCQDGDWLTCEGGRWVTREACTAACDDALGCTGCAPAGKRYCVGNEVLACNAGGTEAVSIADCAAYGATCLNGQCAGGDPCVMSAVNTSNVGCEYWAVDLDQWYSKDALSPDATGKQFSLVVTNPNKDPVTVVTEINTAEPGHTLALEVVDSREVGPDELVRIDLPQREVDGSVNDANDGTGTALTSRAFRVTSTAPIVAYQFNPIFQMQTNDASILIPTPALGKSYWVLGYPGIGAPVNPLSKTSTNYAFVTVVATQPNTYIHVVATADVAAGGPVAEWTPAGEPIQVDMGPFDVMNLEAHCSPTMPALNCMSKGKTDFTGTMIEASAPVAVFSGNECVNVAPPSCTGDSCCCDHLEDQMFPNTSLGRSFVAPHSPSRGGAEVDIWRILADDDDTSVKTSLPAPDAAFVLQSGEFREVYAGTSFTVSADKPLAIAQYLVSQGCTSAVTGDPSFTTFPPVEQYRPSYTFLVPATFSSDYAVVVMPAGAAVTLDGAEVPGAAGCFALPVGDMLGIDYDTVECKLKDGVHRLESDADIGLLVAGYGPAGSYAYAGGSNLNPINSVR